MELAALISIAVLVWYYGHSLKVASEVGIHLKNTLLTDLLGIKEALAHSRVTSAPPASAGASPSQR